MVTNLLENNHLVLVGKVTSEKTYSHEIYGEKFYIFDLEVPRLSSAVDIIPITVSERLLTKLRFYKLERHYLLKDNLDHTTATKMKETN